MKFFLAFLCLLVCGGSIAQEPAPKPADVSLAMAIITDPHGQPLPETMPLGETVRFSAKSSVFGPGIHAIKWIVEPPERDARKWIPLSSGGVEGDVPTGLVPVTITITLVVAKGDSVDIARIKVKCGEGPIPPPDPNPPDPPKPVPPAPVTSFRVIFVYETGDTLTAQQTSARDAKSVRDYLTAKTTKEAGGHGWRSWDRDTEATNDPPMMRALWEAVKPKFTTVPCLVVEVNGKVDILPWPANAAECLATLQKYGGK